MFGMIRQTEDEHQIKRRAISLSTDSSSCYGDRNGLLRFLLVMNIASVYGPLKLIPLTSNSLIVLMDSLATKVISVDTLLQPLQLYRLQPNGLVPNGSVCLSIASYFTFHNRGPKIEPNFYKE